MKNYWFYCYEDDPIKFPEEEVMYCVEPDRECLLKRFGQEFLNKGFNRTKEEQELIFEFYREIRKQFISEITRFGVIVEEDLEDWGIKAKYIPIIDEKINKEEWSKEYIPFGP